jgi:tetratricopeptide (TPR) repeat protein
MTMPNDESLYRAIQSADESDQIGYARHLCERYLKDYPDHVPTLIRHACNLISLAQYSAAQAALDHAQPIAPPKRLHLVIAQRGHLLEAQGDFAGAEELYMQAHELDPDDATYLIYAGSAAFRRGDIARATALARRATDCSDGCIEEAWFNLGGYLLSDQGYSEAANCYRRALHIDPNYDLARKRLSDVELILKDNG